MPLVVSQLLTSVSVFYIVDSWGNDVTNEVEQKQKKSKIIISFECETLKAGAAAEEHIRQFMPKLAGMDAVGKLYLSFRHVKTPNC